MDQNQLLKKVAIRLYRKMNPVSRAVNTWTYYGSTGVRRIATCIFCRRVIATCSNDWPETVSFRADSNQHGAKCAKKFLEDFADGIS